MFFPSVVKSQPYQGTRVKTPARINSAASSAATTAQLSIDNNQVFRAFRDTALALIGSLLH
jgi:hypothetical protein